MKILRKLKYLSGFPEYYTNGENMNKQYTMFVLATLAIFSVIYTVYVLAFPLDMDATVSQEVVELGETVTITVKELELTDRTDWTWHGRVVRYGADGSEKVVAEDSGTVKASPAGNVVWTHDFTAPSSFPVETFKWHGEVDYVKYVVRVTLNNPKKLIGIGMAKTFILVNKRQDILDYMSDTMIPAADNLITAADNELTTKIDTRIEHCRAGDKQDEDVAEKWEAMKSGVQDIKDDAETIKSLLNTAINDLNIKNAKVADDEVNNFWVKHGDTRDEYRELLTEYTDKCADPAGETV